MMGLEDCYLSFWSGKKQELLLLNFRGVRNGIAEHRKTGNSTFTNMPWAFLLCIFHVQISSWKQTILLNFRWFQNGFQNNSRNNQQRIWGQVGQHPGKHVYEQVQRCGILYTNTLILKLCRCNTSCKHILYLYETFI